MTVSPSVAFNVRMSGIRANWYELLPKVEAHMAYQEEIDRIRMAAGWECDEGGWYSPDGISHWDWECEGYPFPEDKGFAEFMVTYVPQPWPPTPAEK